MEEKIVIKSTKPHWQCLITLTGGKTESEHTHNDGDIFFISQDFPFGRFIVLLLHSETLVINLVITKTTKIGPEL